VKLTELELSTWTEITSVVVDTRFLAYEQSNLLSWSLSWRRSEFRTDQHFTQRFRLPGSHDHAAFGDRFAYLRVGKQGQQVGDDLWIETVTRVERLCKYKNILFVVGGH
jgi:hypothetical protein